MPRPIGNKYWPYIRNSVSGTCTEWWNLESNNDTIAMKAGKAGRVKMRQYKIQNPMHFLQWQQGTMIVFIFHHSCVQSTSNCTVKNITIAWLLPLANYGCNHREERWQQSGSTYVPRTCQEPPVSSQTWRAWPGSGLMTFLPGPHSTGLYGVIMRSDPMPWMYLSTVSLCGTHHRCPAYTRYEGPMI